MGLCMSSDECFNHAAYDFFLLLKYLKGFWFQYALNSQYDMATEL